MQGSNNKQSEVFNASDYSIGIVVGDFNHDITDAMLVEAQKVLREYSVADDAIEIVRVPGSVEIPLMIQTMAHTKKFDGLIALGAIIKGESAHFDYVAKFVTDGILRVQLDTNVPVGFGILTTYDHAQAAARPHVGADAARAALTVAYNIKNLK